MVEPHLVAAFSNKGIDHCRHYYIHVFTSPSHQTPSGHNFLANRVALQERDYCL